MKKSKAGTKQEVQKPYPLPNQNTILINIMVLFDKIKKSGMKFN